jgi:hypothetical protein
MSTEAADHRALQRAVVRYLLTPASLRDDAELWELVEDYEPSEVEQGLIPIPGKYAEQ